MALRCIDGLNSLHHMFDREFLLVSKSPVLSHSISESRIRPKFIQDAGKIVGVTASMNKINHLATELG